MQPGTCKNLHKLTCISLTYFINYLINPAFGTNHIFLLTVSVTYWSRFLWYAILDTVFRSRKQDYGRLSGLLIFDFIAYWTIAFNSPIVYSIQNWYIQIHEVVNHYHFFSVMDSVQTTGIFSYSSLPWNGQSQKQLIKSFVVESKYLPVVSKTFSVWSERDSSAFKADCQNNFRGFPLKFF